MKIQKDTTLDELMFNGIISCRLWNVIRANFIFDNYNPKVKDLYPISINKIKSFRNAGKVTVDGFINLYELLDIKIIY